MSVVIPVRNAATTLDEQLTALAAADPPAGPVEIVVVDNGSTDASVEVALAHAGVLRLRVVDASDRPGANHARNHGVLSSRHSRILMCDADDMVDPGWLTAMEGAFEAGHDLVGGPIDYMRLNPPEVRAWRGADKAPVGTVLGFLPAAHGANLGFTREVFDRISGFDDAFVYGGDDVEFCWRAQLAGSTLHVATDAVVHYRLRGAARLPARAMSGFAGAIRPNATARPAWERTVLDDIAAKRPWNLRVKWARQRAMRRLDTLAEGVTVVIVNWNTKDVTADVIRAVREHSAPEVRVLVVDNGSTDGSRELLHSWPGIDTLLLRSNAGHGVALDLAVCSVQTTLAVTLDSDAIPLRRGWLEPAVAPVRDGGAVIAGLRSRRGFVHPVYAAVDTATFVLRRLSFQTFVPPGVTSQTAVWGENAWDTAELLTGRLSADEVAFVDPTPNLVPGLPGMSVGDVVYHHGGVSRATTGEVDPASLAGWTTACSRLAAAVAGQEHVDG